MSDVFEAPGYWMASDGKWYAPDRHPDLSYRERFAAPVVSEPPAIPVAAETSEPPSEPVLQDRHDEFPSIEIENANVARTTSTPLSDIHRTVRETESFEDEAVVPSFSVAAPAVPTVTERPIFESLTPASVVSAPTAQRRPDTLGVELEIERSAPVSARRNPGSVGPPLGGVPSTTSLAPIADPTAHTSMATLGDRVVAATIFAAGVAMIVGTFLDWTTGSLVQTGWDRGDGIATVIAGVIGSAAAGPIYVGFRHILPKSVAIAAGLIGLVVIGLTAISVLFDNASANTSVGIGFLIVFIGSTAMAIAGLADRGELPE